jgi:hypothetical protein
MHGPESTEAHVQRVARLAAGDPMSSVAVALAAHADEDVAARMRCCRPRAALAWA